MRFLILTVCLPVLLQASILLPTYHTSCDYQGTVYQEGAHFQPDACTYCSCYQGRMNCAIQDCAAPPCMNYVTKPGRCCPIYPNGPTYLTHPPISIFTPRTSCDYKGKTYQEGESYHPNPCEVCRCHQTLMTCLAHPCPPPHCRDPVHKLGQCCPVCPRGHNCHGPNGQIIPAGQKVNVDKFTTCECPKMGLGNQAVCTAVPSRILLS